MPEEFDFSELRKYLQGHLILANFANICKAKWTWARRTCSSMNRGH